MSLEHLIKDSNGQVVMAIEDGNAVPLTYSLESLPTLLGKRQFDMLCEALGITDAMREAKVVDPGSFNAAEFVANAIQRKAEQARAVRRHQQERRGLELLEGMLP